MRKLITFARSGLATFVRRFRAYGLSPTLTWLYGRGLPLVTGVPLIYSRVTPQIYVGPQYQKAGKYFLEKSGINGSLNLRSEFDDAAHGLALKDYCYLPVVDGTAPSLEQLGQGVTFIQGMISQGGKVYIHCHGGVGRAPTMAAAYFISQGYSFAQAIEAIRKARPFIELKPAQLEQLERLELTRKLQG